MLLLFTSEKKWRPAVSCQARACSGHDFYHSRLIQEWCDTLISRLQVTDDPSATHWAHLTSNRIELCTTAFVPRSSLITHEFLYPRRPTRKSVISLIAENSPMVLIKYCPHACMTVFRLFIHSHYCSCSNIRLRHFWLAAPSISNNGNQNTCS